MSFITSVDGIIYSGYWYMVLFLLSLAEPGKKLGGSHPSYQRLAFDIKVPYD